MDTVPPSDGNWLPWIITIGVSVIMTLGTTIVGLARMVKDMYAKAVADLEARILNIEQKLDTNVAECNRLREENAGLRAKVHLLEGKKVEF